MVILLAVACDDTEFPTDGVGTIVGDSYPDVVAIFDGYCVSCHRSSGPVARLDLEKIGVKLTTLRPDQAEYIGVKSEGPYKADHYRY